MGKMCMEKEGMEKEKIVSRNSSAEEKIYAKYIYICIDISRYPDI